MEFGARKFNWPDKSAVSLRRFDINIIGMESNHLEKDPADFNTLRSKLRHTEIDGVTGTEVPITAFVSGLHQEAFGEVLYPAAVVKKAAKSFIGQPVVWNHSFDMKDVVGRILDSKGVDIDGDNAKIVMRLFIIDDVARKKVDNGLVQEVSVAMFVAEDFDVDDEGNAINFNITDIRGEHLGFVQRGAVSPGDGAGVGIGVDLDEFAMKGRQALADEEKAVIQLIMSKDVYPSQEEAVAWIEANDFSADKLTETEETWMAEQRDPEDFVMGTTETNTIAEGVQAVTGQLEPTTLSIKTKSQSNPTLASAGGLYMSDNDNPTDPSSGADLEAKMKALEARLTEADEREAALKASTKTMEAELASRRQEEKDSIVAAIVAKNGQDVAVYAAMELETLKAIVSALPETSAPEPAPLADAREKRQEADEASYITGTKFERPALKATGQMSVGGSPHFFTSGASFDDFTVGDTMVPTDEALAIALYSGAGALKGLEARLLNDPKMAARLAVLQK